MAPSLTLNKENWQYRRVMSMWRFPNKQAICKRPQITLGLCLEQLNSRSWKTVFTVIFIKRYLPVQSRGRGASAVRRRQTQAQCVHPRQTTQVTCHLGCCYGNHILSKQPHFRWDDGGRWMGRNASHVMLIKSLCSILCFVTHIDVHTRILQGLCV